MLQPFYNLDIFLFRNLSNMAKIIDCLILLQSVS